MILCNLSSGESTEDEKSGLNGLCIHKSIWDTAQVLPVHISSIQIHRSAQRQGDAHTPFSQIITNLAHLDYEACFTSKLSFPMIQEPWAFLPRKENTKGCLNFWAPWALPSASSWLAKSSEFLNASALKHAVTLRCSSIEPVRRSASLSTPVPSQLKNSSQGLEGERKKDSNPITLKGFIIIHSKRKNRLLSSFSSPQKSR